MTSKTHIPVTLSMTQENLEKEFTMAFPFLFLEIENANKIRNTKNLSLKKISQLSNPKAFEIDFNHTVAEVIEMFQKNLGIQVRILRKLSDSLIETSFTNSWTLLRQNEIGSQRYFEQE